MQRKLVEVAYEITYKCNLRCSHCYNSQELGCKEELTTEQAKKVLKDFHEFGATKLKIGGGEPLVREDFFDVYNYSRSIGYEVNFSTNGLLILENMGKMLSNNVDKLQISLDNLSDKHDKIRNRKGLFNVVEKAISELKKTDIKISIATTLTKDNYKDLDDILKFCREKEVYRWRVMKYIPNGPDDKLLLSKEEYKNAVVKLLEMKARYDSKPEIIVAREFDLIKTPSDYNDMQCFGGKTALSLKPNGDVTPCSYIHHIICGNVTRDNVENIWDSKEMLCYATDCYKKECEHAEKCRGGCKSASYFMTGKFDCDPYCWVDRKVL